MKPFFFSLLLVSSSILFAQEYKFNDENQPKKWSIGLNFGDNLLLAGNNNFTKSINLNELSAQYLLNKRTGIKFDVASNQMRFSNGSKTALNRISVQYLVNANKFLNLGDEKSKLGLFFHLGGGYSVLSNKLDASADKDQMLNAIIGFTPSWRINKRFSVNVDLSYLYNMIEDQSFDWEKYIPGSITYPERAPITLASDYVTLTAGISYSFNIKKKVILDKPVDLIVAKPAIDTITNSTKIIEDIQNKLKEININKERIKLLEEKVNNLEKSLLNIKDELDKSNSEVETTTKTPLENNMFQRNKGYYIIMGAFKILNNAELCIKDLISIGNKDSKIIYNEISGLYYATVSFSDRRQIVLKQLNRQYILINNKAWIFKSDF